MPDTGNPNFFRTFKDRYSLILEDGAATSNNVVMLSAVNDVQICGDVDIASYSAGSAFATLPAECRPSSLIKIPVVVDDEASENVVALKIGMDGSMFLSSAYDMVTVHLDGVSFNISSKFYKEV